MMHKLIIGVVFCLAAFAPLRASAEESCEQVQQWAAQNADRLPATYDAFIQYSAEYRRAMWQYLSPEVKSAIWTRHLELYLAAHPGLTAEQLDVVKQALYLATPEHFEDGARATTQAALKELKSKGELVFDRVELARILVQLGPVDSGPVKLQPLCDCSDDFDCGGGSCSGSRCSLSYGCGPFGMDTCFGFCRF